MSRSAALAEMVSTPAAPTLRTTVNSWVVRFTAVTRQTSGAVEEVTAFGTTNRSPTTNKVLSTTVTVVEAVVLATAAEPFCAHRAT